jgi:SAM-dependent methyltransferase
MTLEQDRIEQAYNRYYINPNYFAYREWLYRPYMKALVRAARLQPGSRVLDAGCGQGFFTWLFADLGFDAVGADISTEGIRAASRKYGASGARFVVADICQLDRENSQFDCVFTRSCSLYNCTGFSEMTEVTDRLLKLVKPQGVFIFDYYTRLGAHEKSADWIYHSLSSVKRHFSKYPAAKVFFSLRAESIFLGKLALSGPVSIVSAAISRIGGLGGEAVAIVPVTKVRF